MFNKKYSTEKRNLASKFERNFWPFKHRIVFSMETRISHSGELENFNNFISNLNSSH